VQHGSVYTCIKCGYRRDVSQGNFPTEVFAALVGIILAFLLIVTMQQANESPIPGSMLQNTQQGDDGQLITD
jgi:hypothetical protein